MDSNIWISLLVVVATIASAIFLYRYITGGYPASKIIIGDPPVEHNGLEPTQARFMFFYTTWCPWSKKAWKPWNAFKLLTQNGKFTYGGHSIIFEEINAEADKGKSALYKVKAYPTFFVETGDRISTFEGVPDILTFDAFLVSAIGKKESPH
jgi:thiol-disulfide isomerase/thioredoxin